MIEYRARCMLLSIKLKESSCLCVCVCVLGLEGREGRCRRRERVSKRLTIPQGKNLTYYSTTSRQNVPEKGLWVSVYSVLPPWNLLTPLSLGKALLFLHVQVLPLITSASNCQH